jgi:glycine hydroxymethyltransferase
VADEPSVSELESAAFRSALGVIRAVEPRVADAIAAELADQREMLKLIASENYASPAVLLAMGNWFSDKYAEGTIGRRFYAGCKNVDTIEALAAEHARTLFGSPHAYVQPHQRLLGMSLDAGGHLTHGFRPNISGKMFDQRSYGTDPESGLLDYDALREQAREFRPLILVGGYSAYPRLVNFRLLREIADEVDATLMVDMAHFAGLVAGKVLTGDFDPIPFAHLTTTTTHKSLRGPRGGMVLCGDELAEYVDRGCPAVLGGPLSHVMAAKAVALAEASTPDFRDYAQRIVTNARALADGLLRRGVTLVTGGTDNHIVLLDVSSFGLTGRQAESALLQSGIVTNRNSIPRDPNGAWFTSGIRTGTPALTTRGLGPEEMDVIADLMATVLKETTPGSTADGSPAKVKYVLDDKVAERVAAEAAELVSGYPLYPGVDLG